MYTLTSQLKMLVLLTIFLLTSSLTMPSQAATSLDFCSMASTTGGSCVVLDKNDPNFGALFEAAVFSVMLSTIQPTITAVSPAQLPQGSTASILITAPNAHFNSSSQTGVTLSGGITLNSSKILSTIQMELNVTVPANTALGPYNISVKTSLPDGTSETVTGQNMLQIITPPTTPTLLSTTPISISRNANTVQLQIYGQNTHFDNSSIVDLGDTAIAVTNKTAQSATLLTAVVNVANTARIGFHKVKVTTGAEIAQDTISMGVLQVFDTIPTNPLLTSVQPWQGRQYETLTLTILGKDTHFDSSNSQVSFSGSGIDILTTTVKSFTELTATIKVNSTAALGFRDVFVTTGTETATIQNGLGIFSPATITLDNKQGVPGNSVTLQITGTDTHFVQGKTQINFDGTGVTQKSITVTNATQATATVDIASNAASGSRNVSVVTEGEVAVPVNGEVFAVVVPNDPRVDSLSPNQGTQGDTVTVALIGKNTQFKAGTTGVQLDGTGITANATVTSPTNIALTLTIASDAPIGNRGITVTTGNEVAKLANAFTVLEFPKVNLTVTKTGNGTVTSSSPTGINCGTFCTAQVLKETTVTLNATPTDSNSHFVSWGGSCTGTTSSVNVTLDAAKICSATFELLGAQLTVTKTLNNNSKGTITSSLAGLDCSNGTQCLANYLKGLTVTLIATPDVGSIFKNWSGDCTSTTQAASLTMNSDKNCTATFDIASGYSLQVNLTGSGKGKVTSDLAGIECSSPTATTCKKDYPANTTIKLTATPADAYSFFKGWSGSCTGSSLSTTVAITNAGKTCTAEFGLKPSYSLQINVTGNGQVSSGDGINCNANGGENCKKDYLANTTVTLTATLADTNTLFKGWSGDCTGSSLSTTVITNVAKSCTATFEAIPPPGDKTNSVDKTIISNPPTGNSGTTTTPPATPTTATIGTTSPNTSAGTSETGVTPATSGNDNKDGQNNNNNKDGQNNNNNSISYNLKVTLAGTGTGTITSKPTGLACSKTNDANCTKDYPTDTAVTLIAKAEGTSTFKGWGGDCTDTQDNLAFVTIDAKKTCMATFENDDIDGDSIANTIEDVAPNHGDGNADGTPDSHQTEVISLPRKDGNYLTIASKTVGCNPQQVKTGVESDQSNQDAQYDFPNGLVSFELPTACDEAQVKLYYHSLTTVPPKDWGFRVYDATTQQWNSLNAAFKPVQIAGQPVVTVSLLLQNDHGKFVGGIGQPVILPKLQFSQAAQTIDEYGTDTTTLPSGKEVTGTLITIKVTSTHGIPGTITVPYQVTSNDTTTLSTEYLLPPSKTLTFADGAKEATIAIFKILMGCKEQNETLTLQLSPPTGGAKLGTPDKTTITIKTNANKGDCTCKNGQSSLALKDPTQQSLTLKMGSEPTLLTLIGGQGKRVLDISPNTIVTVAPETLPNNGDVPLTLTPKQAGQAQLTVTDECGGTVKVVLTVEPTPTPPLQPAKQDISLKVDDKPFEIWISGGQGKAHLEQAPNRDLVNLDTEFPEKGGAKLTLTGHKVGKTQLTVSDSNSQAVVNISVIEEPTTTTTTTTPCQALQIDQTKVVLREGGKPITLLFTGSQKEFQPQKLPNSEIITMDALDYQDGGVTKLTLAPRDPGKTQIKLDNCAKKPVVVDMTVLKPGSRADYCWLDKRTEGICQNPDNDKILDFNGMSLEKNGLVNFSAYFESTLASQKVLLPTDKLTMKVNSFSEKLKGKAAKLIVMVETDGKFFMSHKIALPTTPPVTTTPAVTKCNDPLCATTEDIKTSDTGSQPTTDTGDKGTSGADTMSTPDTGSPSTPNTGSQPTTDTSDKGISDTGATSTHNTNSQTTTNAGSKPTPDTSTTSTSGTGSQLPPEEASDQCSTPELELLCQLMTGGTKSKRATTPKNWYPWNGQLITITAAATLDSLTAIMELPLEFDLQGLPAGEYTLYVGYRLQDGTIIFNGKTPPHFWIANSMAISPATEETTEDKTAKQVEPRTYFANQVAHTENGEVTITTTIKPDQAHLGQKVNLLMVALYTSPQGEKFSNMRVQGQGWLTWDGNAENLMPAQKNVLLQDDLTIDLFQGNLSEFTGGKMQIYVGYEMQDGVIIFNGQAPIEITIP